MRFAFWCGRNMPEFFFYIAIRTKSEQFRARNAIVDAAMQTNSDWLLMLDDDMIIDPNTTQRVSNAYSLIQKLLDHKKDIIGALYYQRGGGCPPVTMMRVGESGYRFLRDDELVGGLQKVDVAGGGCLLVNMRVFDHIQRPYFEPEFNYGTDVQLCRKAQDLGYEVWLDSSIELGHLKSERTIVTSENRGRIQREAAVPGDVRTQFLASGVFDRLIIDGCEYTGFKDLDEMTFVSNDFLFQRQRSGLSDPAWYREYPKERVARQIWYNTSSPEKNQMTQFILQTVDPAPKRILDFGCGIGIPAFTFAEQGHKVTAVDIKGTGTLDFLRWRSVKHLVNIDIRESLGGVHYFSSKDKFDIIVVMDCLEHVREWRAMLKELAAHLLPGGVMFCNNGILDDTTHPEHYELKNKDFINACMEEGLMPFNQITYVKSKTQGGLENLTEAAAAGAR